ncbi:MAG: response regulator transcription factor, partial [Bacteroidota bacterium]
MTKIKLAITDDHSLFREGFLSLFNGHEEIEFVSNFDSATDTIQGISKAKVDILFLDINLPDMQGTQLCKKLKSEFPDLKIIALSSHAEP